VYSLIIANVCVDNSLFVDRRLFCEELRAWISDVTGIEFTDRVDLSCSKYEYTGMMFMHVRSVR